MSVLLETEPPLLWLFAVGVFRDKKSPLFSAHC